MADLLELPVSSSDPGYIISDALCAAGDQDALAVEGTRVNILPEINWCRTPDHLDVCFCKNLD